MNSFETQSSLGRGGRAWFGPWAAVGPGSEEGICSQESGEGGRSRACPAYPRVSAKSPLDEQDPFPPLRGFPGLRIPRSSCEL